MSKRRALLFCAIGFVLAAIVFFPLSVALDLAGAGAVGISGRHVRGTIWNGRIDAAQIGGVPLGDLDVRLMPMSLLRGRMQLDVAGHSSAPTNGRVWASPTGFGADALTATLPVGPALSPLPSANVSLVNAAFAFEGEDCRSASGQVRLTLDRGGPVWPGGSVLMGPARCVPGVRGAPDGVGATLRGASALDSLTLSIRPDGRYSALAAIRATSPMLGMALTLAGFRETQAGYVRQIEGQF